MGVRFEDERFVLTTNKEDFYVSVLDTEEDENLELFGAWCSNEENMYILADQLDAMVRCLNGQDSELKNQGIIFP